jgi:hypothetical protein
MRSAAKDKLEQEKQWLLSKIGLIPDMDDGQFMTFPFYQNIADTLFADVMDEQKWSSCSWLLLQECKS